jgi:hypothetical protein
MNDGKPSKSKHYFVDTCILVLTLFAVYASEKLFSDLKLGVIAGVLVGVLAKLFEVRYAIQASTDVTITSSRKETARLIAILSVYDKYFHDGWLFDQLRRIVELREIAERQPHALRRFERIVQEALSQAEVQMGNPERVNTNQDEDYRLFLLHEAVKNSKDYIWAVTFDEAGYFDRFWISRFGDGYIRSNFDATRRGVTIKRIFVVQREVLTGKNADKARLFSALIKKLRRGGENMHVYVIAFDDLPGSIQSSTRSFLVADDYITSESIGLENGIPVGGYVAYGERDRSLDELKRRFEYLEHIARERGAMAAKRAFPGEGGEYPEGTGTGRRVDRNGAHDSSRHH